MTTEGKFTLWCDRIREAASREIFDAPINSRVTIAPPKRSGDQNAKMHAMIRDLMKQKPATVAGKTLDEEGWKQAMMMAMGHQVQFLPNPFDGTVCAVAPRTSRMTVEQCGEAIEFLFAAGAEWGVVWSEDGPPKGRQAPPIDDGAF